MIVREIPIRPEDLYDADEVFFTGTAAEITPIGQIDNRKIRSPNGEITKNLKQTYLDVVHGKNTNYLDWLTFVN